MSTTSTEHSSPPTWAEQAARDRSREESSRRRLHTWQSGVAFAQNLRNPLSAGGLLLLAALSHGAVFGDASGYVAAIGGVVVGMGVAALSARLRLGCFHTVMLVFAAYLLTGGPLALPETTTALVVPSLQTLQMLVLGIVTSWKDLLTLQPPVGNFVGPTIMPFTSAVSCAAVAMTIVMRTRGPLWALIPIALLLCLGILWGSQEAPLALPIGIALGVGSLVWATWVVRQRRGTEERGTIEFFRESRVPGRRTVAGGVALIAVGTVAAVLVAPSLTSSGQRSVLRDAVEPPLDLHQYHSPISQFRWLSTTAKDTELFTIAGLAQGERIRLATLDQYDGTVFKIAGSGEGADFHRVGSSFTGSNFTGSNFTDDSLALDTSTNSLQVTIADYSDYWLPGGGVVSSFAYAGAGNQDATDSLYYSENLDTGLSTRRLQAGDRYTVVTLAQRPWTDSELEGLAILNLPVPQDSNVPVGIRERAAEMMGEAAPGIAQVRAIQQKLQDEGYYSDGSDGLSLAGHRADRLERFLEPGGMIGNDDQYAAVMALMLRSQGIPSRVVMGFHPEQEHRGPITVTGGDTRAWVEVPFENAGWVAFDPTPPKDRTARTTSPRPNPTPLPQVLQLPDSPEVPAEVPPDVPDGVENDKVSESDLSATAILILQIIGVLCLVALLCLLIVICKGIRSRRRRRTGREDMRTASAWDEVVDSATDLGLTVSAVATRFEQAHFIDTRIRGKAEKPDPLPELGFRRPNEEMSPILALAARLDKEVFGEGELTGESRRRAWDEAHEVIKLLRGRVPWHRRIRAVISLRSLRARRRAKRPVTHRAANGETGMGGAEVSRTGASNDEVSGTDATIAQTNSEGESSA